MVRLGVQLLDTSSGDISYHSSSESLFVVDVKAKKHLDPVLMEVKYLLLSKLNVFILPSGNGALKYHGRLCMPNTDNMRLNIIA